MKTLWDPAARAEIVRRLAGLTPSTPARWGRMDAPQMVAHCADAVRMAFGELGELTVTRTPAFLRYTPVKQLTIYWLPWPQGSPTAPELRSRAPGAWEDEVRSIGELLDRFASRDPNAAWPSHPAFGRMSGQLWGGLGYRHFDHHLRQFGV